MVLAGDGAAALAGLPTTAEAPALGAREPATRARLGATRVNARGGSVARCAGRGDDGVALQLARRREPGGPQAASEAGYAQLGGGSLHAFIYALGHFFPSAKRLVGDIESSWRCVFLILPKIKGLGECFVNSWRCSYHHY